MILADKADVRRSRVRNTDISKFGQSDFRGSALAYIIIQFPDMSNRAGLASPALPETAS